MAIPPADPPAGLAIDVELLLLRDPIWRGRDGHHTLRGTRR
jgi:hypothetical protein